MNIRLKPTADQERRRMEGLRALARIIARHYLDHPELYPTPAGYADGGNAGGGEGDAMVNPVARAEGDPSPKETDQ